LRIDPTTHNKPSQTAIEIGGDLEGIKVDDDENHWTVKQASC